MSSSVVHIVGRRPSDDLHLEAFAKAAEFRVLRARAAILATRRQATLRFWAQLTR